jgi:transcriptional regulator with XRE-family HTH domain
MDGQAIKATLGKNIKFLRHRKALTQANLAEKANISIIFLSSIERGTKYPKPDVLAKIANALEIEAFELFKANLIPEDQKKMVNRLTKDIKSSVITAMDDVIKQYMG